MQITNPTFGSDFEMAVLDSSSKKIKPVCMLLGGTKNQPEPIGKDCYKQEDGPMAEFNIKPVTTLKNWRYYFKYCIQEGNKFLAKSGNELIAISSHTFEDSELNQHNLRILGCSESLCAYSVVPNNPCGKTNLRTTGVHIQIGFDYRCPKTNELFDRDKANLLAKYFDTYMGIPSILLDTDSERRKLYGKAGDFRFGSKWCEEKDKRINLFEYRSLGGGLLSNPKNIDWLFKSTKKVVSNYNKKTKLPPDILIRTIINNNITEDAKKLIKKLKIELP
jgi:hypothetical protein